jgi:hypothetical protein
MENHKQKYMNWSVKDSYDTFRSSSPRDDDLLHMLWLQLRILGPNMHSITFWKEALALESMVKHTPGQTEMTIQNPNSHFLQVKISSNELNCANVKIPTFTNDNGIMSVTPSFVSNGDQMCLVQAIKDVYRGLDRGRYLSFEKPGAITKMVWGRYHHYRRKYRQDCKVVINNLRANIEETKQLLKTNRKKWVYEHKANINHVTRGISQLYIRRLYDRMVESLVDTSLKGENDTYQLKVKNRVARALMVFPALVNPGNIIGVQFCDPQDANYTTIIFYIR